MGKREKGDALGVKTEKSNYSEVLKAMRIYAKLTYLGVDVRSIKRTRTSEVIHELKRDKTCKDSANSARWKWSSHSYGYGKARQGHT